MSGELLPGWHPYLSTWCLHGKHKKCGERQAGRGEAGPPHCKSCPQVCICPECRHVVLGGVRPRGVFSNYKSLKTQRLHVIRDEWMTREGAARVRPRVEPGRQTLCGQPALGTLKAPAAVLDPLPTSPPEGFTWCPTCVGVLAEWMGLIGLFGVLVASAPAPGTPEPLTST